MSITDRDDPAAQVPPPPPPDDGDAWYAPRVRAQEAIHPGVVVTITESEPRQFAYRIREPSLSAGDAAARERIEGHFEETSRRRPRTREGAVERAEAGFTPKYERVLDRLLSVTPAARRRLNYYALRDLRLFGPVTPLALDERIEVADAGPRSDGEADGTLVVHTDRFAPAETGFAADAPFVDRIASERLERYEVGFAGFAVPVVLYRDRYLGDDRFATKYAVLEPALLPGDEKLIAECKERVWESNAASVVGDRESFVRRRARAYLSRRLTARNTRAWLDAAAHRVRAALADLGVGVPPVDDRYADDRLEDLLYHVLREFVGQGPLTVPLRDPHLEDIEANRVGERVKVVPRGDRVVDGRVPTNLRFERETAFVDVVTHLAARDGEELNGANPSAKVNLDLDGVDERIRCAVALPVVSEDGPHVSVRKQAADAMTPVDLIADDALSADLVALLWLAYEHDRVVLFCGPTGVGKTTLMNAHMPFVPFDDRPISIDEGSREVRLPHETGVSLTTRDHESEYKRVSMADLMTETNYLNPDLAVVAEVNTPESFETFAQTLNTGHGVVGTTHAEDVTTLVNRTIEQGLAAYLLAEIDLAVFPRHVDGDRYVGEAVELLDPERARSRPAGETTGSTGPARIGEVDVVEKDDAAVGYHVVYGREPDGEFTFVGPDGGPGGSLALFERIAASTDRPISAVVEEFRRKRRYVRYVAEAGIDDFDALFGFLADLRTDEAATVERIQAARDGDGGDGGVVVDGGSTGGEPGERGAGADSEAPSGPVTPDDDEEAPP